MAPEDMIIEIQIDVKDIECEFDPLEVNLYFVQFS